MNIPDLGRPSIIGLIDALIFILVFYCILAVLNINLFGTAALLFLFVSSVIVGWRGAVYSRHIVFGRDRYWKAASEGFFWGGGIMLAFQAGVTPFHWQSFITIGGGVAVVAGLIGALVGASLLFMNRIIVKASSSSYSKHAVAALLLIAFAGIGGVLIIGNTQTQGGGSAKNDVPAPLGAPAASVDFNVYQSVISKELPGYTIFRNEDFLQDEKQLKNFLTTEEIAQRRARSLGVIEGRFNEDALQDFAALVVNRSVTQTDPKHETNSEIAHEEFSVRLIICFGTKQQAEYLCDILYTLDGDFVSLPYRVEFEVFKAPGEFSCGDVENQETTEDTSVQVLYPERWSGNKDAIRLGVAARRLHLNHDGVGIYRIGQNYGWTLIRQADGSYLNCANVD